MDDNVLQQPVRTIVDVARLAGVTPSTVSRSLAGKSGVRPETRQRITEIARAHGFSVNLHAKGLRLGSGTRDPISGDGPALDDEGMDPFLARLTISIIDLALKCGTRINLTIDGIQSVANERDRGSKKTAHLTVSPGEPGSETASYRVTLLKTPSE